MVGIYMSGTGNTKHCTEKLLSLLGGGAAFAVEDEAARSAVEQNEEIILAYPTHYSNVPYMVRDFILRNAALWHGKKVFCLATMGLFSGDGAGCSARILKKYGAQITGGLHILMPDSIGDCKLLKKSAEEKHRILNAADEKLERAAGDILQGKYPHEGLGSLPHLAGLFGQRLWFSGKTRGYSDALKISAACTGCGLCSALCPMGNISVKNGRAVSAGKCAMCYRCISSCPNKAITLVGKEVFEQYRYEKYANNN